MREAKSILVVDDERVVREGLVAALTQAGYRPVAASSVAAAKEEIARAIPSCVLLDIRLKDGDGLALLSELATQYPRLPIIMATAFGDSERTIAAMRDGAFEYVTKPFDLDALLTSIERAVREPIPSAPIETSRASLVGSSERMLPVWKAIGRAATSAAPALITGETGVGKELVARAIHDNSARAKRPFVAVNLSAVPATLIESELFGHEKGAFTGADSRRAGRFEQAGDGTLFLDEIGDLGMPLQTKLLRVLQEGTFERVGGSMSLSAKARIIAATSKPVSPKEPDSVLREDLYYRLGVLTIEVPALRERPSDIPLLVQNFLAKQSGERRAVSEAGMAKLCAYDWPGNVRELLHALQRACAMQTAETLDASDFDINSSTMNGAADELNLYRSRAAHDRQLIEHALRKSNGNRSEAARLLGVARPQLYAMMAELKIEAKK